MSRLPPTGIISAQPRRRLKPSPRLLVGWPRARTARKHRPARHPLATPFPASAREQCFLLAITPSNPVRGPSPDANRTRGSGRASDGRTTRGPGRRRSRSRQARRTGVGIREDERGAHIRPTRRALNPTTHRSPVDRHRRLRSAPSPRRPARVCEHDRIAPPQPLLAPRAGGGRIGCAGSRGGDLVRRAAPASGPACVAGCRSIVQLGDVWAASRAAGPAYDLISGELTPVEDTPPARPMV